MGSFGQWPRKSHDARSDLRLTEQTLALDNGGSVGVLYGL